MNCRRCSSTRLINLDKKLPNDNDVFRCLECGYLFSPSRDSIGENAGETGGNPATSRTTAVQSGYPNSQELGNART